MEKEKNVKENSRFNEDFRQECRALDLKNGVPSLYICFYHPPLFF